MKPGTATALQYAKHPRRRLVVGSAPIYNLYLRNFLYTPVTARRLDRPGPLYGTRPSETLLVLLPNWREYAEHIHGLFWAVCDWKTRWRDIGTEEIPEEELVRGLPERTKNLLQKYQSLIEKTGSNYLAIESAREWIRRLDERDSALLEKALNLNKKEEDPGPEKISKSPLA